MKHILILLVICLTLTVIWFHQGTILGGGDAGLAFYSPSSALNFSKTSWVEYGTGTSTIGWLPSLSLLYFYSFWEKIGIPTTILQASYFFVLMFVGVLSIYFLTLLHLSKKNQLVSFITAVFYLFNPFTMSQIWARGILPQQTAFALLPLAMLLFELGIKRKSFIYSILLVLATLIFSTSFSFLTFIIVFWLILLILLLFNLTRFSILFFTTTFLLWIVVHAWWFIPLFLSSGSIYSAGISDSEENLGTLLGVSRNFTPDILIRLLQRTYFYDPSAFSKVFVSLPLQLISWLPFIFMTFGLFKIIKSKLLEFKVFVFLLILGMIISLGANPPFGLIFVKFFKHFSVLQAFRNPFEKFGLVYVLGYSPVFAYGLVSFSSGKKYKNLLIVLAFFLICGIFAWPMWTGRAVAGPDKKIGLSVPVYYKDLQQWLNGKNEDYRIFMTPLWSGDGAFYQWGASRYQGSDPMLWLLNQPSISNSNRTPFFFEYMRAIRKNIEQLNLAPSLALLRAKYLINRNDAILISDAEKKHINYLTEEIFPPLGEIPDSKKVCNNLYANSQANNTAWITCQISTESDWSNVRYLHVKVRTNVSSLLDVAVKDKNGTRVRWDGRSDIEYSTKDDQWTEVTIPLGDPTEYNSEIDFSKIDLLEVQARQKDNPQTSVWEIYLDGVSLDTGKEEKINVYHPIATFGNLKVYEPNKFNAPPEFGVLSSAEQVNDMVGLFEAANRNLDKIDYKGFIVVPQNPKKNLQNLSNTANIKTIEKKKVSNTRYWLKLSDGGPALILLSKTFNTQWKLIPAITLKELSGNLFTDPALFKKIPISENYHFVVNGYGNLWKTEGKEMEYGIIYMPQLIADIGMDISELFILLIIGFLLADLIKKYAKYKN